VKRLLPIVLLAAATTSGTAQAWNPIGYMWDPEEFPIEFWVTDYLEDSLPQTINAETGLYYQEEAMIASFANWEDADCAVIDWEYTGLHPGNGGAANDGINKVFFDDPGDDLGAGINAVMSPRGRTTANVVKDLGGELIFQNTDNDIIFNDNIDYATTDDIDAGRCNGESAVESTGTHEVGHLLGMAHSCEEGEICVDESYRSATMYWTGGSCDTSRADINSDDIAGITALYGPYASFAIDTSTLPFGPTPLGIQFNLVTDEVVTTADWNFGDGSEGSTELEPYHEYETQGQFTPSVVFSGESEQCGTWTFESSQLAAVLACEIPEPVFSLQQTDAAGFVDLDSDTIAYQVINETDVSTYGCIDTVSFVVEDGSGAVIDGPIGAWSPVLVFPNEGDFTVRMVAGGPAGRAEATLALSAEALGGCASTGAAPVGGLAGLLLALVAGVRRRED
jgi:hypothetical protein